MQKRFCTCGHMILVRYFSRNGKWQPQLVFKHAVSEKHGKTTCCPNCGNAINIHALR